MRVFDDVFQVTEIVGQPTLLVRPDHLCLIDTGEASDTDHIYRLIASVGRTPAELEHILITHADADHVGGLPRLVAETQALVHASGPEVEVIEGRAASRDGDIVSVPVRVDRCVEHGDYPIGDTIRVVATPGHTVAHVSYYLTDHRALIAGDCLNNVEGLAGSMEEYTLDRARAGQTIVELARLEPAAILFGHGLPITEAAAASLRTLARNTNAGDHAGAD